MASVEQREKLLRYYKGTEGEEIAIKLVDLAEQTCRSGKFRLSEFLDPYGQEIAETIVANYPQLRLDLDGGYLGAERQRAIFADKDFGGSPGFDLALVELTWNDAFSHLGHRDVLGAVMSLGLERDSIGDIIINAGNAGIITSKKIAEYLMQELVHIANTRVEAILGDLTAIAPKEEKCKEIRATVASLRADSVVAAGYGISRSRAAADIDAEKLKLNWQSVKGPSQVVKEGDIFSMRGRGRLELAQITGNTKKGRIGILLKRYY